MARWSVDAMAEQAGRFAVVTGVINFGATGVTDGLNPIGVEIALEGGSSWGASDQARYDAWAQQGQSTDYGLGAIGIPAGLDPVGVGIALEGGTSWGLTDQARYDAWADVNATNFTVLA